LLAEGFHHQFGGPMQSGCPSKCSFGKKTFNSEATLYVSLEPCCTFGKTPPCTDRILEAGIKDVRISILDPNPAVAGQSISLLRKYGIQTKVGISEADGHALIKHFRINILQHRPYVILKWAQVNSVFRCAWNTSLV
jgi:diaminohydroxyphosphoribosylaminopyrimidine deaminase/5-amino-6-(5-phosphoribosylamino)uracil reductase